MKKLFPHFVKLLVFPAALLAPVVTLTASGSELYWSDEDGAIWGSGIDGDDIELFFDGEGMGGVAPDIVVTDDYIYWTENAGNSSASIWRVERNGSGEPAPFVEGFFTAPHFMAVDEENGFLYFSDYSEGIFRADLDEGGSPDHLLDGFQSTTPATYTGLALEDEDTLFFLTAGGELHRLNDIRTTAWWGGSAVGGFPGGDETYGLVYDEAADTLYYTDFGADALASYNLTAEEGEILIDWIVNPLGLKFSPSGTHLVIAQRNVGVSGYQLDNGGFELLADAPESHFGVAVTADPGQLEPPVEPLEVVWSLSPGDRDYLTSNPNRNPERGMAVHPEEGYVLVAQGRATPPTVAVLDGMTGDHLGELSVEGVSGGTSDFNLNKIAITEDGTIYGTNLTVDTANENFRLYRWSDRDADPELVVNAALNSDDEESSNRRFGDSIVVRGSGDDLEIFLSTWDGTIWALLTPLPDEEISDPENQYGAEMVAVEGVESGLLFRDIAAGPGNLFYGSGSSTNMPLFEFEFDPDTMTATVTRVFDSSVFPIRIGPVAVDEGNGLFGGIDVFNSIFYLYHLDDLDEEADGMIPEIATRAFPTNEQNTVRVGVVAFHEGMVYAFETNNGIMAMDLGLESEAVSFESWMAGFDLPPESSGPADDASGDGIRNAIAYALDLDPRATNRDHPSLPARDTETENGEEYLSLRYIRPEGGREDVTYTVEAGGNLGEWGNAQFLRVEDLGDGFERVVYRDTVPLGDEPRRFMRLDIQVSE